MRMVRPSFETCQAPCRPVRIRPNESSSVGKGGRCPWERCGRRHGKSAESSKFGETCGARISPARARGGRERRGLYRCGWVGKQAARTSRRLASALALIPCAMRRRRTAPLLAPLRARHGFERGRGSAITAYNRTHHGCDCTNA